MTGLGFGVNCDTMIVTAKLISTPIVPAAQLFGPSATTTSTGPSSSSRTSRD